MLVASCIPFPFSASCDDMLTMLVCATHWLSLHIYTLAYIYMHKSCSLVCCPCFNAVKSWTFDPNLHLSLANTIFCLLYCLFALLLVCSLSYLFACFLFLCLPCLSCLSALCLFHTLFAPFPSIACLLVSCLYLCMYTHEARTLGAMAWSLGCKQKWCKCEHIDVS